MVWARLVAGRDKDGRAALERIVYEPAEGWDAVEARLFDRIMNAGEEAD